MSRESSTSHPGFWAEFGRAVYDFWTRPIRAEPLALFRIAVGVSVFFSLFFGMVSYFGIFWGPGALISNEVAVEALRDTPRFSLFTGPENIPFLHSWVSKETAEVWVKWINSWPGVIAMFSLLAVSLVTLAVGFYTRTSAFIAYLLVLSFNHRALWALNGGDDMALHALFYLVIAPSGAAWSIDAVRRRLAEHRDPTEGFELSMEFGTEGDPVMIAPWSVRLIQIQLCLVYFFTGITKLSPQWFKSDWIQGDALYWVLQDLTLTRWAYSMVPVPMFFSCLASWGTVIFEIGFPIFVLFKRLRPWVLAAGTALHIGIWVSMEIHWFSPNTMMFYPVFLSGMGVVQFFHWFSRPRRGDEGGIDETTQEF